jgi:hypothetical protein
MRSTPIQSITRGDKLLLVEGLLLAILLEFLLQLLCHEVDRILFAVVHKRRVKDNVHVPTKFLDA